MSKSSNVREVALDALISIEKNQAYSNLLLNSVINKHHLNEKDVGLLTELVYGTLQRRDTLSYYLSAFTAKNKKLEKWVETLLKLSIYQMVYLERIPDRAVIFEAVEIAKKRGHKGISSLVNGILRGIQRNGLPNFDSIKDPLEKISVETSHPYWLVKQWADEAGIEEARRMCEINLQPPIQTARINRMRTTMADLLVLLEQEGISAEKGDLSQDSIKILKGNLARTAAFKNGLLTIQDESSMLTARALNASQEDKVLDACAAPGGKTSHIAELMDGQGKVVSLDLHEHKVKLIKEQAERLGLQNVDAKAMDARLAGEAFQKEEFSKVLVDAPCSGFGVIRRKPDIKYTKKPGDISKLASIQLEILNSVAPLVKKGGTLVYSTCTIEREENKDVVNKFLESHPQFEADTDLAERMPEKARPFVKNGQLQLLPHYFGTDGFFIASLKRKV
ncbi:16S rRNA (cytosine(967)-C(5))-methyltransferase RsmB [Bacillus lacus]|uniref:16S rRNA (cytosine(967)-C(5))-methyltransferase n=1 Tax=Metabacillus lacus TaxID=1983721 RepID=A0A7X2J0T1_9BACI|nr:16S rRNA (cytosine(967)-C(5))-methyltransferase RsmB [Metabacillus lacus]MRX73352.1 16S rRNA (cytosine(967)-C(5))-methyltransferase RsmB [Metabacillus lacus]